MAEAALLALIALIVRIPHLGSATPWYDEFYHLLAARQWLEDGSFGIAGGEYTRASLFTRLAAVSMSLFGDTLAAGRLPSLLAGVGWAVLVFVWTRRLAGPIAGWTAGLLFALDPGAIYLSQMVRFYTWQGLLVGIGLMIVYHLTSETRAGWKTPALWVAAILSFAVATHLQATTLIAVAAAALWVGGRAVGRLPGWVGRGNRGVRKIALAAAILAILALLFWSVSSGSLVRYWNTYTGTFYWMSGELTSSRWYVWWLRERYPTLWTLFPLAAGIALIRYPRPALFSGIVFVTGFVGVSLASARSERYLYFALPFLFAVWGMALATLLPALRTVGVRAFEALGAPGLGIRRKALAGTLFAGLTIGFLLSENNAFRITLGMLAKDPVERPYREADWSRVLPRLQGLADSAEVVLSSYVLKPLYYLDRGDAHLSWTETAEAGFADGRPVEFSVNERTGLPGLSTPAALERVMSCYPAGLVLTERFHLNRPHLIPEPTTAFLQSRLEEVPLDPQSWVVAYRWRRGGSAGSPGCPPPGFRVRNGGL